MKATFTHGLSVIIIIIMETFLFSSFKNTYNELNTTTNFERNTTLQEEKHLQIRKACKIKTKVLKI